MFAGNADNPTPVGNVESRTVHGKRNSRRWSAITPGLLMITNRVRNRIRAVAALLGAHAP